MEHKDVEAEIKKKCEKCGFPGKDFPHVVRHRSEVYRGSYGGEPLIQPEVMIFVCSRCSYEWEIEGT